MHFHDDRNSIYIKLALVIDCMSWTVTLDLVDSKME